jgi:choline dehydrogenase-like flavoprotein
VIIDGRLVAPGTEIVRDVCIIGAGPAGISIATRLQHSGIGIAILESGGLEPTVTGQALCEGTNVGHPYFRLDGCRFRMLGGSGNVWGGWSRPLDPADFESRPSLGSPGWPISAGDLVRYNVDAARLLRLPTAQFGLDYWLPRLPGPIPLGAGDFENGIFQYSPVRDFGREYRRALEASLNIELLLHANATGLLLDADTNRVGNVRVQAIGRAPFTVRAKVFVLAAGGLENARLLLASQRDRPAGLGNEHDAVGRHFMEHLHAPVGHMAVYGRGIQDKFYDVLVKDSGRTRGVILGTEEARKRHDLPGCSIAFNDKGIGFNLMVGMRSPKVTVYPIRLMRTLGGPRMARIIDPVRPTLSEAISIKMRRDARRAAKATLDRAAATGRPVQPGELCSIYLRAEQLPSRGSRVTLTREVDALGMPRIQLDWRVSAADTDAIDPWLKLFAESVAKHEVGRVFLMQPGEWLDHLDGGPHHMGTTRMSDDPHYGVVDRNCRVHSVANLYVAGSSSFATGSYTNPTFTLLALALRLADHIGGMLAARTPAVSTTAYSAAMT